MTYNPVSDTARRWKGWHVVCILPFGQRVHWQYLRADWKRFMKDYPTAIIWVSSQEEACLFKRQEDALAAKFRVEGDINFTVTVVHEDERCDPRKAWSLP